jgi:nucleoside-diphosphate-sugar epimerase
MSKVLVTGSAGFIGGYVVSELLDKGYQVVGLDNLSKYGEVTRSFDHDSNYKFIPGDARDFNTVYNALEGCEHLIAGAAMIGGISYFHTFSYDLLATNERIIATTCDAAVKSFQKGTLKKVTYLSSSMVFESTSSWPSKEGDELKFPPPISSYGFQKLAVEYFARSLWDQYQVPYTILRPFNCVGIGEQRALTDVEINSGNIKLAMSHVVPDLVQKILKGQKPLRILGDGSQVRCYTYGSDLAKGIVSSLENPNAINEDFNLSTTQSTTVLELANVIWKQIHGSVDGLEFLLEKPFKYDVQKRIPDVSKATKILGFEATTTLEEMLREVIPWIDIAIKKGSI